MSVHSTHETLFLEKFSVGGKWILGPDIERCIADTYNEHSARRIVACWNACDEISTEKLEQMPTPFMKMVGQNFMELWAEYTTVKAQRDDLLEACKSALSDDQPYIEKCRAAIAKAEEGREA